MTTAANLAIASSTRKSAPSKVPASLFNTSMTPITSSLTTNGAQTRDRVTNPINSSMYSSCREDCRVSGMSSDFLSLAT